MTRVLRSKPHPPFLQRQLVHLGFALGLLALSLAGLVVIAVTGLLLAPGIHHLMHRLHWEKPPGQE